MCAACGARALEPHLEVRRSDKDASLVATTTSYGRAPGDIVRCRVCGHMQVGDLPSEPELQSAYAEVSEAAYVEEEEGQRATAARTLEIIERHRSPGRLVDLGCWVGYLPAEAQRRGWEAWGVEPSRFASEYARDQLGLRVQTATLHTADLPAESFDAVVLGDVIEHLPNPGEALVRIRGLLVAGGVVHLALPDAGSRVARVLGSRWWSVLPTHVQYFTRSSLAMLLSRSGFEVQGMATAPKAFSVGYYLSRLEGYSPPVARAGAAVAERAGVSDKLVWPDFRDRMAVVARRTAGT